MKELVFIHTKGKDWNIYGEIDRGMDFLLGTVQTVEVSDSVHGCLIRREDNGRCWYIHSDYYSEVIPNNPLSKLMFPEYVEYEKNTNYLVPKE